MDAAVMTIPAPAAAGTKSKLLYSSPEAAETARNGGGAFCAAANPVLFRAAPAKPQAQEPQVSAPHMGACYPKCMNVGEDPQLLPGVQAKRPMNVTPEEAALVSAMQTFDLEELGLAAAPTQSQQLPPPKSIVVDYEDSDGEHPEPRDQAATCAPSACGPLTGGVTAVDSSNGRLPRRRSRGASIDGSLRGKSVIFEQEGKAAEPSTPATSDTDAEEGEARCSKVHKLCMCEVKLHRSLESCWLVSSGQVYDVTGLVTAHPGGVRSILRKAGGPDCARDMKFHTKNARKMMEKCFIGKLQQCGDDVDCSGDANCSIM